MSSKVEYEREECGRCGGSGQHSYNQVDGSRCYGCGGTGKRLTKRGAAARAFASSLLDTPIEAFAEMTGRKARYADLVSGKQYVISGAVKGRPTAYSVVNGERIPIENFKLLAMRDGTLTDIGVGLGKGIRVRLIPDEQDIERIAAYQAGLTKAGKPRKARKANKENHS